MISSRKQQLSIALILACTCVSVLGTEPNEAKTELRFEISPEKQRWLGRNNKKGQGPIRPMYAAKFFINFTDIAVSNDREVRMILESSAGQSISTKQREFLTTGTIFSFLAAIFSFNEDVKDHYHCCLYAVSQDDAKKMVEAFIEVLTERANAKRQEYPELRKELEDKIAEAKKNLPEKETEAKAAKEKYQEIKKNPRYFLLADSEAYEKAKETILQMNKMLDTLNIEIAGIRAKLETIEKYRADRTEKQRSFKEAYDKLDYMFIEQMIELKGAEARKEAVLKIRKQEEGFRNSFDQWISLEGELRRLKDSLSTSERRLRGVEKRLAKPGPDMLPPKVYQNKVTIYPVRLD